MSKGLQGPKSNSTHLPAAAAAGRRQQRRGVPDDLDDGHGGAVQDLDLQPQRAVLKRSKARVWSKKAACLSLLCCYLMEERH